MFVSQYTTHPTTDGYPGHFSLGTPVNHAAMNVLTHVFYYTCAVPSLGTVLGVELLGRQEDGG